MSIFNLYKRTLEVAKVLNKACFEDFQHLLLNGKLTDQVLTGMFEKENLLVIREVLNYESNLFSFYSNSRFAKDEILTLRAQKIIKVNKLTKNYDFTLLDYPLIINNQINILQSEYDWSKFKSILTFNLKSHETFLTLIKISLIDGILVNEISLNNFDLILSDLKEYNSPFSGQDIFKTILEGNKQLNESDMDDLKNKINEKLLEYLIVYDAVDFFEE